MLKKVSESMLKTQIDALCPEVPGREVSSFLRCYRYLLLEEEGRRDGWEPRVQSLRVVQ